MGIDINLFKQEDIDFLMDNAPRNDVFKAHLKTLVEEYLNKKYVELKLTTEELEKSAMKKNGMRRLFEIVNYGKQKLPMRQQLKL